MCGAGRARSLRPHQSGHDFGGTLQILGVILPIYAIIDMIETAENVWSDCCVCAMVDKSTT